METTTKIKKWGNSLAVRIPRDIIKKTRLGSGASLEIREVKGMILIKPLKIRGKAPSLEELVKGITPQNRHKEVNWGKRRGREVW